LKNKSKKLIPKLKNLDLKNKKLDLKNKTKKNYLLGGGRFPQPGVAHKKSMYGSAITWA